MKTTPALLALVLGSFVVFASAPGRAQDGPAEESAASEPAAAVTPETAAGSPSDTAPDTAGTPGAAPALEVAPDAAGDAGGADADASETEPTEADAAPAAREDEFGIRATVEIGFLGVLAHELQLGMDGTRLDYPTDFAQSNLYLFARVQGDFDVWRQHILTFVYQPIDIETRASTPRDLRIDGLDVPRGTPMRARYGFPFYRLGWAFDVLGEREHELAFGLGLQLRNAAIEFATEDGTALRARNDVGPVPLLRARGRFEIAERWFIAFEADGFYAFIPGLNGTDNNVEGAIADLSLRIGWRFFPHVDGFLNVRYLGGGAAGQGDATATSDGFQRNWLHFMTLSLGATIDSRP